MILHNGRVIDYLGSHQHLVVDLDLKVTEDGSLLPTTHGQRFYEGRLGFRFPLLFSGEGTLHESYDEDAEVFRISLEVRNRVFGFLFGYQGEFRCEFVPAPTLPVTSSRDATNTAPDRLLPLRWVRGGMPTQHGIRSAGADR